MHQTLVRVATFNVENNCKKYGWKKAFKFIDSLDADLVFLQEVSGKHKSILSSGNLNFIHHDDDEEFVVAEDLNRGILLFNCHFSDEPYIAFEADGIKYDIENEPTKNKNELKMRSLRSRVSTLKKIEKLLPDEKRAVIAAGDFNEPSHRDWTDETTKYGTTPFSMIFPTSFIFEHKFGFLDTFRYVHKDPVSNPGITWPSQDSKIRYPHREDRIDFIFSKNLKPIKSKVVPGLGDHNVVITDFLIYS